MAADWRGWRLIVVNGERFRWQFDSIFYESFTVRVRPEAKPSCLLVGTNAGQPSAVRAMIETAIARGWPNDVPNLELK